MSPADRRERFVEAAIRVMTRDGVPQATTRAIAGEAGMPLGMFHYVFESKRQLIALVAQQIARGSRRDVVAAIAGGARDGDAHRALRDGLMAYLDHVIAHPEDHLVTYELTTTALRDPDLEEAAQRQYETYLTENERLLASTAELVGVEFTEPLQVVGRYLFSVMDGLALSWLARRDDEVARAVVEVVAHSLVAMTRPREEASS